jgi:hypothetical protein
MKSTVGPWKGRGIVGGAFWEGRSRCRCRDRSHGSHVGTDCTRRLVAHSSRHEGICGLCVSDSCGGTNRVMGGALSFKPRGEDGRFLPEPFHRLEDP